nr:uncharacterized protein LOC121121187 isoform X2 [Lepeophtheirus salmonis]
MIQLLMCICRIMKFNISVLPVLFLLRVVPTESSDNIRTRRRVKYAEDRVKKSLHHTHSPQERIYNMFNNDATSHHHRSKKDSYTSHYKQDHHPFSHKGSHHIPHKKHSYTQHPLDPREIYEPVHQVDSTSYQHEYESGNQYKSSKHHHTPSNPQHHSSSSHHTSSSHQDKYTTKESTEYYQFGFQVNNEKNLSHGHMEFEKGGKKVGQYKILLPDGRLQVVSYEADAYGFRPIVRFIKPKGYKEHAPPKQIQTVFQNVVQTTTTKRPITTTVTTVVPSTTTISTTIPSIISKYKNEKKRNQNIIVIQLPESYKKGEHDDHLQSTVYDIVDKLTNYQTNQHVTFGENDHLKPKIERTVSKYGSSTIRKRPSLRFSDPPPYKSYELTAENRHPIGVYHPDYLYSGKERDYDYDEYTSSDYMYQEEPISKKFYVISVDKEESDTSPTYVLARRKDDRDYYNF